MTEEQMKPKLIYTTVKGDKLTHYVLAERMVQYQYYKIVENMKDDPIADTLTYILEEGFTGYHQLTTEELISEYNEVEWDWYKVFEADGLPWDLFEEDPLSPDYESDLKKQEE